MFFVKITRNAKKANFCYNSGKTWEELGTKQRPSGTMSFACERVYV